MNGNSSKINLWMVSTFILLGIIIGFGASRLSYFDGWGGKASTTSADLDTAAKKEQAGQPNSRRQDAQSPQEPLLTSEQIARLPDDDPFFGLLDAPVTVVEFSDFQCPFCAKFFKTTFAQIDEAYIKTGKVKFVYRDFPLDFHAQSQTASLAAQCANEQGKFREMHDAIFENQTQWSGNNDALALMKNYAKEYVSDGAQFDRCMASNKYLSEVRKDVLDGATVGVSGTPSFFINGKGISGALPYETVFQPILEAELAGQQWELQYDSTGKPTVRVF